MDYDEFLDKVKKMMAEYNENFEVGTNKLTDSYNKAIKYSNEIKNIAAENSQTTLDAVNRHARALNQQGQINHDKFTRLQEDLINLLERVKKLEVVEEDLDDVVHINKVMPPISRKTGKFVFDMEPKGECEELKKEIERLKAVISGSLKEFNKMRWTSGYSKPHTNYENYKEWAAGKRVLDEAFSKKEEGGNDE